MKMDAPPCWSSALCSHVFPTKPCGHMVSETKVTETGMGNRVRAAALRIMEAPEPDGCRFFVRAQPEAAGALLATERSWG